VVQRLTGDYPAATASLTQALELFRDLGDRHCQAGASINLAGLLSLSLAYREARGYFVQALSIARDIDTPAGEAQAREGTGRATSKQETQAKAPKTYNRPSRSTAASAPQRPSAQQRPPRAGMTTEGGRAGPWRRLSSKHHQPRLIRRVQRHRPAYRTQISGQRTTMRGDIRRDHRAPGRRPATRSVSL